MPAEYRIPYDYVLDGNPNTHSVLLPSPFNPEHFVFARHFVYICPQSGKLWARAYCGLPLPGRWQARYACRIRPTSLFTPVEHMVPGFLETLPEPLLRHEFLALKEFLDDRK